MKFLNEDDGLFMIELNNGKMVIHNILPNRYSTYTVKAIRNIIFQYPLISYIWGTRELWVQDLNNKTSIYYFDDPIVATENVHNVITKKNSKMELGMVFQRKDHFQTAIMKVDMNTNIIEYDRRIIEKSEVESDKIKGYYRIPLQNPETKSVENAIMIHQSETLSVLSLQNKSMKYDIKKKYK